MLNTHHCCLFFECVQPPFIWRSTYWTAEHVETFYMKPYDAQHPCLHKTWAQVRQYVSYLAVFIFNTPTPAGCRL